MSAAAPRRLYFIAARRESDTGEPHAARCLIRVNTPMGAPHVACAGSALGARWLELMGVAEQACLVADHELSAEISFDVSSFGVLVFENDAALDAYLMDADGFDYRSRIIHPALDAVSGDPW